MEIGILGCGNMGSAIARAVAGSDIDTNLVLFDIDTKVSDSLAREVSGSASGSPEQLAGHADITILAVKPQILPKLYPVLSSVPDRKYISIAAGVSLSTLCSKLNTSSVIRFMPNIAASVSRAVTAVAFPPDIDSMFRDNAFSIAESCGSAFELPENLFSAFIGISGSAIAFFYQFLHATALGGTREGIPYQTSLNIAADTYLGAISLLKENGGNPAEIITRVTSAGGTTIEGIHALEKGNFNAVVMDAVTAASQKAIRLESSGS